MIKNFILLLTLLALVGCEKNPNQAKTTDPATDKEVKVVTAEPTVVETEPKVEEVASTMKEVRMNVTGMT